MKSEQVEGVVEKVAGKAQSAVGKLSVIQRWKLKARDTKRLGN